LREQGLAILEDATCKEPVELMEQELPQEIIKECEIMHLKN
jgi:hypothetical protein